MTQEDIKIFVNEKIAKDQNETISQTKQTYAILMRFGV